MSMFRNDLLNPKEIRDGYYEISGHPKYAINKHGDVKKIDTWKSLLQNSNSRGYRSVSLKNENRNKFMHYSVHRLMATTFLYRDPTELEYYDMQVNHKDSNTSNNELSNLEWVTPSENVQHASWNGLHPVAVQIEARNIQTGEVLKFPTKISCARYFNLNKDTINYRIHCGPQRVFPEMYQYRTSDFDKPWPEIENPEYKILDFGHSKAVLLKEWLKKDENGNRGRVTEFDKIQDMCDYLGVDQSTGSVWLNFKDQPVLIGLIQVKLKSDPTPWREIDDPWLEYVKHSQCRKVIKCVNDSTGDERIFGSAVECAKVMGIKPTALNWRLKTQGIKTYSDGYRYGYYPFD